jgi:tRNA nucleotidyltransferase (CCA-adding enzyme)
MAFSLVEGLIDPFDGQADITAGLLRAVGDADQRIAEDALRIMRAIRFASTLGFSIEPGLGKALRASAAKLRLISAERIQAELMRLLSGQFVSPLLLEFGDILSVPIPEISATFGFDQRSPWHHLDVWQHTVSAISLASPVDPVLRLALLFHDLGKPATFSQDQGGRGHYYGHAEASADIARMRLRVLRFDRQTIEIVCELINLHRKTIKPQDIRAWLRDLGERRLVRLLQLQQADLLAHTEHAISGRSEQLAACFAALDQAIKTEACYSLEQLAIKGDDLLTLGVAAGPEVGRQLNLLLDAVIAGELPNQRQALLTWQENQLHGEKNGG